MQRVLGRDQLSYITNHFGEQIAGAVQRPAAVTVAVEADLEQGFSTLAAEGFIAATLHHPK